MRLVILAAGQGSRLTGTRMPKALLSLGNGETVAERLIRQADLPTTIVVGYKADVMTRWLDGKADFVYNQAWEKTTPMYSLKLAALESPGPSLVVYGDTVFTDTDVWAMKALQGTAGVQVRNRWGAYLDLGRVIERSSTDPISEFTFSGILNTEIPDENMKDYISIGHNIVGYDYERIFSININDDEDLARAREWIKSLS